MKSLKSYGVILGLVGYSSYSVMDLMHKYMKIKLNIGFFTYYFYISLTMMVFFTILGFLTLKPKSLLYVPQGTIKFVAIKAIINILFVTFGVASLARVPLHIYYPILFTEPIISTFMASLLLKEKINSKNVIALIVAFSGVIIAIEPWQASNLQNQYFIGILMVVFMAFIAAMANIVVNSKLSSINPITTIWYGTVVIFIYNVINIKHREGLEHISSNVITLMIITGFFMSLGALYHIKAFSIGPVKKVTLTRYIQLAWGIFYGAVFFKDIPNALALFGSLAIILANVYNLIEQ